MPTTSRVPDSVPIPAIAPSNSSMALTVGGPVAGGRARSPVDATTLSVLRRGSPCSCSSDRATGLPFMLLDALALATMSSASGPVDRSAELGEAGMRSSRTVSRIQSTPSATLASSRPVSATAARRYFSSASPGAAGRVRSVDAISAATLASITGASSAAQIAPCAAATVPPITPANPCTAPSFAFARAIPPSRLQTAMSDRAARSEPSR